MNKLAATLLLIASIPFAAQASPVTNLVNNGSFEADHLAAGSWSVSGNLSGWTGGAYGIELRNNVAGTASDGSSFVELDTTANSSMSQTLGTVLGQWYVLSFDYADRAGTAASTDGLAWSFGNSSGAVAGTGNDAWHHFSTRVQATGSNTTLSFSATGTSDSFGSSLDNVSLTNAVPEPAGLALVLGALGALALATRRRPSQRRH